MIEWMNEWPNLGVGLGSKACATRSGNDLLPRALQGSPADTNEWMNDCINTLNYSNANVSLYISWHYYSESEGFTYHMLKYNNVSQYSCWAFVGLSFVILCYANIIVNS